MTNLSNRKTSVRDRSRMTGTILRSLSDHLTREENHCKRIFNREEKKHRFSSSTKTTLPRYLRVSFFHQNIFRSTGNLTIGGLKRRYLWSGERFASFLTYVAHMSKQKFPVDFTRSALTWHSERNNPRAKRCLRGCFDGTDRHAVTGLSGLSIKTKQFRMAW